MLRRIPKMATSPQTSHITNDKPTDPVLLRISLGVTNIPMPVIINFTTNF